MRKWNVSLLMIFAQFYIVIEKVIYYVLVRSMKNSSNSIDSGAKCVGVGL